ncbi:MAG: hypothetical protein R6U13_12040 [Desulfatiglandaceae bacterium]
MWKRIGLRRRIFLLLVALVAITVFEGSVMVWYTYRMQERVTETIHSHVEAFQAAEMLQTALSSQKGFVSYYLLDGNPRRKPFDRGCDSGRQDADHGRDRNPS